MENLIGIILVVCIVMVFIVTMKNRQNAQRNLKIDFFNECKRNKIYSLDDPYKKQKAELIAQRMGFRFTNIEKFYQEAKEIVAQEDKRIERECMESRQQELQAQRREEMDRSQELTRFAHYQGRDKRVAMLECVQGEYRQKAKEIKKTMNYSVYASQQREINWEVAGGIASGIAGGAAGLATALDAQKQNEKIRAQNKATMDLLMPGVVHEMNNAYDYERKANNLQASIDNAKIKIVADIPDEEVFSYLDISTQKVSISRTGAFSVTAEVSIKKNQSSIMLGNTRGVVDGTIAAELYQQGNYVGCALMVLPALGVRGKTHIEGIGIADAKQKVPYEIKFKPYHLWVIEA